MGCSVSVKIKILASLCLQSDFARAGLWLCHVTQQTSQEKLTRLYERYRRYLRAHRKALVGQSTIPRPDHDPARARFNPRPQITSHHDIVQRFEAHKKRFAALAQGGLNTCEIG
jgi:hypothetical protein